MLTIKLVPVPPCLGIYTVKGVDHPSMPARMRLLHPEAADAFHTISDVTVVSDMYRSPESSLQAVRSGRGALRPGYSAHGFGLAIDIDIRTTMTNIHAKTKLDLDVFMAQHGFYCHRQDHVHGAEAWHYNFLGFDAPVKGRLSSDEIEERILSMYGPALSPDDTECQRLLAKLRMYAGEIDGEIGPRSREAIRVFKRAWGLLPDDHIDTQMRRTLAFVACEHQVMG